MILAAATKEGAGKALRVLMAMALALSMCVAVPRAALAAQKAEVTIGDDIPYAGYATTRMWADGQPAYCADPSAATPAPGSYNKSEVTEADLEATMWFAYGAPGFDESMWPSAWYDGSGWTADKYIAASHVIIAYAYQDSKAEAVFGTDAQFSTWAKTELLAGTYKAMKSRRGEVSTGFSAYAIDTGDATQALLSFTWETGGLRVAKEDSQTGPDPQGDAALSGAEFQVVNVSGKSALVGGKSYADGQVVKTITARWDAGARAYVASTGAHDLPCGTYEVVESKAPDGYKRSTGSVTVKVAADGQVAEAPKPVKDDVIRGGVQVVKSDLELGASEALGGSSHDALTTGSTLSGIEFTVSNASKGAVVVDGKSYAPGEAVAVIATAWDEAAGAYVARTADDALPYGTYTVQETKANGSYLLTDGEPRTFQVRQDDAVVEASADGGALEFSDQVVRNDLEFSKMAEDTNASLQVAFKITNVSTGEAHVLVTDRNGNASTASSWNAHSKGTNGNDGLLEAGSITADMMDPKAGIWFGLGEDGSMAAAEDSLGALPYGEYLLEELRSDTNEGYDLVRKTFVIERDSTVAKAVWMSLDDRPTPAIATEATDASDGDHVAQASGEVTITDTVWYENLKAGTEYTLTGTLMLKSTGEPLTDAEGNPVTASTTFKAKSPTGQVELGFAFDGSLLAGDDVVAFESLESDGIEVAAHADIEDEDQTVHFVGIGTTATDKADGDKLVTGDEAAISDEVAYTGLTPGAEYVLTATLVDAATGEPLTDGDGLFSKEVAATVAFIPEEADGAQAVEIAFDATGLGGRSLVVFERLETGGVLIASHEDPSDEGQTVTVCEIGTTLTDAADGDHIIASGKARLTDAIEYKGLVPGQAYTVHGTLMCKSTGMPLEDADGKPVTVEAEFTPDAPEGTVDVTFEFDASALEEGAELVAFEEVLTAEGNLAAAHQDINDDGQTVVVDNPETPGVPDEPGKPFDKTGIDLLPYITGVVVMLTAAFALISYGLRKRRQEKDLMNEGNQGDEEL